MNAMVMYDRETDTLWSQFLGQAVQGPLDGTELELVPSQITTWARWKAENPDTLALNTGLTRPAFDSYSSYYLDPRSGRMGQSNRDGRLFPKELVLGVFGDSGHRAYAFRHLSERQVINDELDGLPIIVALNSKGGATAYEREVQGRTLSFEQADDRERMRDVETGSSWSKASGLAIRGPMKGERLPRVASFAAFWFSWSDFYPATDVYVP